MTCGFAVSAPYSGVETVYMDKITISFFLATTSVALSSTVTTIVQASSIAVTTSATTPPIIMIPTGTVMQCDVA